MVGVIIAELALLLIYEFCPPGRTYAIVNGTRSIIVCVVINLARQGHQASRLEHFTFHTTSCRYLIAGNRRVPSAQGNITIGCILLAMRRRCRLVGIQLT